MALSFDGVDDGINLGDWNSIDGAAALTIMGWTYTTTIVGAAAFFTKANGSVNNAIAARRNAALFEVFPGDGTNIGSSPAGYFTTNTWIYTGFVFNGAGGGNATRLLIYKDAAALTVAFTGTIPATLPSDTTVAKIGLAGDGYWAGRMEHVRVWTAALTTAEIQAEMYSRRPSRTTNLIGWWPMDDAGAIEYARSATPPPSNTVTGLTPANGPALAASAGAR